LSVRIQFTASEYPSAICTIYFVLIDVQMHMSEQKYINQYSLVFDVVHACALYIHYIVHHNLCMFKVSLRIDYQVLSLTVYLHIFHLLLK